MDSMGMRALRQAWPHDPACTMLNGDCIRGVMECRSVAENEPCWLTDDIACCRRNDKTRCCYCSIYLGFLEFEESGRLCRVPMSSHEDPVFSEMGKRNRRASDDRGTG